MYNEVSEYFHDNDLLKELEYYSEIEKSHSKFIKREYYMTNNIYWITNYKEWKNIKSIGYEKKTIEFLNNDKKIIEERFFIISLKLIRYKISMNTEEELEKIFKIINTAIVNFNNCFSYLYIINFFVNNTTNQISYF